jgi:hypothetical protein
MNPATEENINKLATCKGRFTGDPSHDFECKTARVVGEGEEEHLEEDIVSVCCAQCDSTDNFYIRTGFLCFFF